MYRCASCPFAAAYKKFSFLRNALIGVLALIGWPATAAGSLDYLQIDNDIVVFSTTAAKTDTSPSCVTPEHADNWAVALTTDSGRAMYALLVSALSTGNALNIASAGDCSDATGIERPAHISVVPGVSTINNGTGLGLYHSDGVTFLGRIVSAESPNQIFYIPTDNNTRLLSITDNYRGAGIWFSSEDCLHDPMITTSVSINDKFISPHFNNGLYYTPVSGGRYQQILSILKSDGTCQNQDLGNRHVYHLNLDYEDPICGRKACIIK